MSKLLKGRGLKAYGQAALTVLGLANSRHSRSYLTPVLGAFGLGIVTGTGLGLLWGRRIAGRLNEQPKLGPDGQHSPQRSLIGQSDSGLIITPSQASRSDFGDRGQRSHNDPSNRAQQPLSLREGRSETPSLPASQAQRGRNGELSSSGAVIYSVEGGILFSSTSPNK